jgi:hypothetical protein
MGIPRIATFPFQRITVTLSTGEVIEQCQPLKRYLPKLATRQLRKKFSKNWRKQRGGTRLASLFVIFG